MKTVLKSNVLTVVTGIKKADYDKKVTDLRSYDKDGNPTFEVKVGKEGAISKYGMTCNTVVDGELAVTIILPIGQKVEDTKVKYGKALVATEEALKDIIANIEKDSEAIDKIFAEAQERHCTKHNKIQQEDPQIHKLQGKKLGRIDRFVSLIYMN